MALASGAIAARGLRETSGRRVAAQIGARARACGLGFLANALLEPDRLAGEILAHIGLLRGSRLSGEQQGGESEKMKQRAHVSLPRGRGPVKGSVPPFAGCVKKPPGPSRSSRAPAHVARAPKTKMMLHSTGEIVA